MTTNRLVTKEEVTTYATVLIDGLQKAGGQDAMFEVREQLEQVAHYFRTNMELSDILCDTSYTPEQLNALTRGIFTEIGVNPVLVEVLSVMAERGDIKLLPRVCASYEEQLENRQGVTLVDVTTSVSLDDNLRQLISKKVAADLGTEVVLREHIDQSILGGIVMSAHGKRIDASVQSQLENARNVLKLSTDGGES